MQKYASIRPGIVSRRELSDINLSELVVRLQANYATQFMGRNAVKEARLLAEVFGVLQRLIDNSNSFQGRNCFESLRSVFKIFFIDQDSKVDSFINLNEFNPFLAGKIQQVRYDIQRSLQPLAKEIDYHLPISLSECIEAYKSTIDSICEEFIYLPRASLLDVLDFFRNASSRCSENQVLLMFDNLIRHINIMQVNGKIYGSGTLGLLNWQLNTSVGSFLELIPEIAEAEIKLKLEIQLRAIVASINKLETQNDDELLDGCLLDTNDGLLELIQKIASRFELPDASAPLLEDLKTVAQVKLMAAEIEMSREMLQLLLSIIIQCKETIKPRELGTGFKVLPQDYELFKALLNFVKQHAEAFEGLLNDLTRVMDNKLTTSFYNALNNFIRLIKHSSVIDDLLHPVYEKSQDKALKYFEVSQGVNGCLSRAFDMILSQIDRQSELLVGYTPKQKLASVFIEEYHAFLKFARRLSGCAAENVNESLAQIVCEVYNALMNNFSEIYSLSQCFLTDRRIPKLYFDLFNALVNSDRRRLPTAPLKFNLKDPARFKKELLTVLTVFDPDNHSLFDVAPESLMASNANLDSQQIEEGEGNAFYVDPESFGTLKSLDAFSKVSTSILNNPLVADLKLTSAHLTVSEALFHSDASVRHHRKLLRHLYEGASSLYQDVLKAYLIGSMWLVYMILSVDGDRVAEQTTIPSEPLIHGLLKSGGSAFLLGVALNRYRKFSQRVSPHLESILREKVKPLIVRQAMLTLAKGLDITLTAGTILINNTAMTAIIYKALMDNISAGNELINYYFGASEGVSEAYGFLVAGVPVSMLGYLILRLNIIDLPYAAERAQTVLSTTLPNLPKKISRVADQFFDGIARFGRSRKGQVIRITASLGQDLLRHFFYTFVVAFPALAVLKVTEALTDIPYDTEKAIELGIYAIAALGPALVGNALQSILRSEGPISLVFTTVIQFINGYREDLKVEGHLNQAPTALRLYSLLAEKLNSAREFIGLPEINAKKVEDSIVYFLTSPLTRGLLALGNIVYLVYFVMLAIKNDSLAKEDLYAAIPTVALASAMPFLFFGGEKIAGYVANKVNIPVAQPKLGDEDAEVGTSDCVRLDTMRG